MKTLLKKCGRPRRIFLAVSVVVIFSCFLLFAPHIAGVVDSGDFMRVIHKEGLVYLPAEPGETEFFDYFHREYAKLEYYNSDRGVQYACNGYRRLLKKLGFLQSMSRKSNFWDNAPMESFFGTLKTELIYHEDSPDKKSGKGFYL